MKEQKHTMKPFSEELMWDHFSRYLGGEMEAEEKLAFEEWMQENPSVAREFKNARFVWKNSSVKEMQLFDTDRGWGKLSGRIHGADEITPVTKKFVLRSALRIAASILFLMVMAFLAQKLISKSGTVTVTAQEKMTEHPVVLPDGSRVFLNAGSSLTYPKKFGHISRNIQLAGEAYFEVAHNPALPFVIQTHTASISVLGTSFNVFAYHDRDSVEVTVATGMVEMESKINHGIIRLAQGNTGVYYAGSDHFVQKPSDMNNLAWKTNIIVFREAGMDYVTKTLGRIFNKSIRITPGELKNCRLTGEFRDQDFDKILDAIRESLNIKITHKGNFYILNGPGC